jgi:hypothetical protein
LKGSSPEKAVAPKKSAAVKLSADQKAAYKELLSSQFAGQTTASAWAEIWKSTHLDNQEHFKRKGRKLPANVLTLLGGMYAAHSVLTPDVAAIRRAERRSAEELRTSLVLNARLGLLKWHTVPNPFDLPELFRDSFAARDEASLQWALRELPFRPCMESDASLWAGAAYRAIAGRDTAQMQRLADRWPHPARSRRVPPAETVLLPILQGDADGVVQALNALLEKQRRSSEPEGFGVFSWTAHACYFAAHRRDPALLAEFDVAQRAPWDAEFHALAMKETDPLARFDFASAPVPLRDLLLSQEVPQWLRGLQADASEELVELILLQVGPQSNAVRGNLNNMLSEGWTPEEFAHRTAKLPLTIASAIHPASGESFRDILNKAGAVAEVIRSN